MSDKQFDAKQIAAAAKQFGENAAAGRDPNAKAAQPFAGETAEFFTMNGGAADASNASAGDVFASAFGVTDKVPLPGEVTGEGLKTFLSGIVSIFRDPKTMITTAALTLVWTILAILRTKDPAAAPFLSWLTGADCGLGRSLPGTIGGILGKGVAAAGLLSLAGKGGLQKTLRGAGRLLPALTKNGAAGQAVKGALAAAFLYIIVFAGPFRLSAATAMAGIGGALLSLRALGSGEGFLSRIAAALTAETQNGVRQLRTGKLQGLLAGLAAGFAAVSVLSAVL